MLALQRLFFFNDTATTEIYTLSLHDALPISRRARHGDGGRGGAVAQGARRRGRDRKSTRLNSSHQIISYAVFCLKKKTHAGGGILNRLQATASIYGVIIT